MSLTSQDWASVATGAAAIATAVLAVFTYYMARKTKDVAEHTKTQAEAVAQQVTVANDQVAVAQRSHQAAIRPWLTAAIPRTEKDNQFRAIPFDSPVVGERPDGGVQGIVPLRNIGLGLAVIDTSASYVSGGPRGAGGLTRYTNLRASVPVVPPGEPVDLHFSIQLTSAGWTNVTPAFFLVNHSFAVTVQYSDWAGGQVTVAYVEVGAAPDDSPFQWAVYQIGYHEEGSSNRLVARFD
jgi:hypothetical protein